MAVNWYKDAQDFYAMTTSSIENVETIEFESGKKRYMRKNTTGKKAFSFSFNLIDKADETAFWTWYDESLCSRANTVYLTDLVKHTGTTEYRMTEEPALQNSQYPKECQLSVEEE